MEYFLIGEESNVSMRGLLVIAGLAAGILSLPIGAFAEQTDYSAGKSPAQLFSGDCSACHASPKGLAKGKDQRSLSDFLREHYTTRPENAGALAGYLLGNPGTAAPIRNPTEASDPRPRNSRGTPAPTPAVAPPPPPVEDDPIRRIFRSGDPEPGETPVAAPEPVATPEAAKPEPKGKKGKPRTVAEPAAREGRDAASHEPKEAPKEVPRETAKPRKNDNAGEAAREAVKAEDAARDAAAAREAAARAEAAKAEAARVRAYATSGEEARPKETVAPEPAAPTISAPPAPPAAGDKPATPSD